MLLCFEIDTYTGGIITGTQWEQLQAPSSGFSGWAYLAAKSYRSDGQAISMHSTDLCLFRFTIIWTTNSSCTMIFWLGSLQLYRERNILKDLMKLMISPQNFPPKKPPTVENTIVFQKVFLFYTVFSSVWCISHIHFLITLYLWTLFYIWFIW